MDINEQMQRIWRKMEQEIGRSIPEDARAEIVEGVGGDAEDEENLEIVGCALRHISQGFQDLLSRPPIARPAGAPVRRAKPFNRRVYMAYFVISRVYTGPEFFLPLYKGQPIPKRSVPWRELFEEWNELHPSDPMSSVPVFKASFYRAKRDDEVLQEILRREILETQEFQTVALKGVDAYNRLIAEFSQMAARLNANMQKQTQGLIDTV